MQARVATTAPSPGTAAPGERLPAGARNGLVAFSFSTFIHAALLVLLALLPLLNRNASLSLQLQAAMTTEDDALPLPDSILTVEPNDKRAANSAPEAVVWGTGGKSADVPMTLTVAGAGPVESTLAGVRSGVKLSDSPFDARGPFDWMGEFGGQKSGAGGNRSTFFGVQAYGRKVVYIMDVSGSMTGHRFKRARTELRRSLRALDEGQEYFVIFFSSAAFPMPGEGLTPATQRNLAKTQRWISKVRCNGSTQPLPALLLALQLQPDAVFFLTDGQFDPQVIWKISQPQGRKKIPIHTIGFSDRAGERLLQEIARQSEGVYRFVP